MLSRAPQVDNASRWSTGRWHCPGNTLGGYPGRLALPALRRGQGRFRVGRVLTEVLSRTNLLCDLLGGELGRGRMAYARA